MLHIKLFEAFESQKLSKTLGFLKKKEAQSQFLENLKYYIQTHFDFPKSEIEDDDIQYLPYAKAVDLRHPNPVARVSNLPEYTTAKWLKYWFTTDGDYLGSTITDDTYTNTTLYKKFQEPHTILNLKNNIGMWTTETVTWNKSLTFNSELTEYLTNQELRNDLLQRADFALVIDLEKLRAKGRTFKGIKKTREEGKQTEDYLSEPILTRLAKKINLDGDLNEFKKILFRSRLGKWILLSPDSRVNTSNNVIGIVQDFLIMNPDKELVDWGLAFKSERQRQNLEKILLKAVDSYQNLQKKVNEIDRHYAKQDGVEKENWELLKQILELVYRRFSEMKLDNKYDLRKFKARIDFFMNSLDKVYRNMNNLALSNIFSTSCTILQNNNAASLISYLERSPTLKNEALKNILKNLSDPAFFDKNINI